MCFAAEDNILNHDKKVSNFNISVSYVRFVFDIRVTDACTLHKSKLIELKMNKTQ